MNELVIGDNNKVPRSYSTIVYFERGEKLIQKHISHNGMFFSVSCNLFDFDYLIMKDSEEGKKLQEILSDTNVSAFDILNYTDELAMKNMSIDVLRHNIQQMKSKAFREGENNIKMQFKKLISI